MTRVYELLSRCGFPASVLPPTALYNEGWLLRLIVDRFARDRSLAHPLSFLPRARWYSEGLLPSRFLSQHHGDTRAETFTHADGVIGHFSVNEGNGAVCLWPQPAQFLVIEAKLHSGLSPGTKRAPNYDQAARSVACMVHLLKGVDTSKLTRFGFYVLAPEAQITAKVFGDLVTTQSIYQKVLARVGQYHGQWDDWFRTTFEPALSRIELGILPWESVLDALPQDLETHDLRDFYRQCLEFNRLR